MIVDWDSTCNAERVIYRNTSGTSDCGQTTISTAYWTAEEIVVYYDRVPISYTTYSSTTYSSTTTEFDAKAAARKWTREQSLQACRYLAKLHHTCPQRPPLPPNGRVTKKTPGKRSTQTAIINFRQQ